MLSINMSDVMNVVNMITTHLIVIGVVLVLAIVATIAAVAIKKKSVRKLVRGEAWIAFLLVVAIVVGLICTGPMSSMLDLVSADSNLTEETTAEATALVNEICEDGIVLAKDEDNILPLASNKVNVFGWASTNPCYGGTGSGALNTAYPTVTLLDGLADAGIEVNSELTDFYVNYKADRPSVGMWAQDWTLPEPNVNLYTDDMMANAQAYSDTAIIVITRVGGEGADLPTDMCSVVDGTWCSQDGPNGSDETYFAGVYDDSLNEGNDWDEGDHFLQLSNREEEMVDLVCSNFDNVVVVYNGANAMELGWVNDYEQIKGVLIVPGTGQSGFDALGEVLTGAVNPSGRTVDTYVADLTASPNFNNIGSFVYDNMSEYAVTASNWGGGTSTESPSFVNYVESIYVGYKFYETADVEGLIDYDEAVVYPFGYGLSYTTFEETLDASCDGENITASVTVTNTGSVAGKDVVELYYTAPYINGGIEKASTNLLDFGKTETLEPGASQTIEFSIPVEQMASFDTYGYGCYVLDAGTYTLELKSDSHNVIASYDFDLDEIVYDEGNKRDSDETAAVSLFQYAEGEVTYLSRADGFANYDEATAAPSTYSMTEEQQEGFFSVAASVSGVGGNDYLADRTYIDQDNAHFSDEAITTGADNGLTLMDVRGLDYDDPQWDLLLDELTLADMDNLIAFGGYQTAACESVGKIRTNDCDGPASINNNFTGVGSVGFPAAVMIAQTWNDEMAYAFGDSIGEMADEMDTSGWYGPAMNTHRSAFAGRNFEYYSEDGVLSGSMAANAIQGAQAHGVYAYMKHFALNDQESNRCSMVCTWSTEQAIRENYLKPFEIACKEGGSLACMTGFNYIGNRWAGGTYELQTTVLRDEWGFKGFCETDYFGVYNYMSADQGIRNGSDLMLVAYETATNHVRYQETNQDQQAMRQAAHRILYVVANSRSYTEENYAKATGMPSWQKILIAAEIAVAVVIILLEVLVIRKYFKNVKKEKAEKA